MNDYPEGLPLGRQADRSYQTIEPTVRSDLESGRSRQRLRYDFTPANVAISWLFTDVQCRLFEVWFRSASGTLDGSQWFDIPLGTPLGTNSWRARFKGVYSGPSRVGRNLWSISATLELEDRPTVPPDWLILPTFILRPDIFDIAMSREWPEHIAVPPIPAPDYSLGLDFQTDTYFVRSI